MSRILITTDYLRPGDEVDRCLRARGHTTTHTPLAGVHDPEQIVAAYADADAALVGHEPLTAEVLVRLGRLRVVVRTGVGYDAIDAAAAARLGITVSNLPGINANAVAEYTLGLLLASARRLVQSATSVAAGGWPREHGRELRDATLGLLGYGAAARAVVPLARAFGMRVLCTSRVPRTERTDPDVRFVDLPELLSGADYLSVHTALTEHSRGLLDAAAFRQMKPDAFLINTARGGVVDEAALADAVRGGRIAGAALDVVGREPLPADSPLRGVDGIVVYSHLAGQTAEARAAAGLEGAAELLASLAGRPQRAVNAGLLYADAPPDENP
ncbi:NAD(P)-dependent oxidoreductase [Streptomyces sp. NPDC046925]|uniref:NAD(P)-dependent oxidoreductase n=1 Tax=Streptomyces sp. NPDC046925 TaxID=3155375 RepID=UPI0033F1BFC8